ncbi:MAG: tRNA threonylcarbamoyladenosine dehydratase [Clostridiales bacterium]|nr:tRNA threonylcarbamoyladenosine dehydratase [Clostridiales bacterium]
MKPQFVRTARLIGEEAVNALETKNVCIFGIGGVGSFAAEALCRAGVGALTLIDGDTVAESNLNRQLIALHSTIGQPKVDVMKARMADINPDARVTALHMFYDESTASSLELSQFDYVVDAIDSVPSKIALIKRCHALNVPLISCMGTGNKLDPSKLVITDISKTNICPLARVVRRELRRGGIAHHTVLYSPEPPMKPLFEDENGRSSPASIAFVPSVAGLMIAGYVVRALAAPYMPKAEE